MEHSAEPDRSTKQYGLLRQQIAASLQRARAQKLKLKDADRRLSIASFVLSAIATFITGQSALAGGPIIGNWRFTATIASVCTLGATVTAGIHRQVVPTDLMIESSECVAQLKALTIETVPDVYDIETVKDTYQHLIAEFSSVDC